MRSITPFGHILDLSLHDVRQRTYMPAIIIASSLTSFYKGVHAGFATRQNSTYPQLRCPRTIHYNPSRTVGHLAAIPD